MKTAIMQPYFFPYIGYWQLINAVDQFVIFDDVNYIKGGWISRNNVLCNGRSCLITLPLSKASQNKLINEIEILNESADRNKLLRTMEISYGKAPYFEENILLIKRIISHDTKNLAGYLAYSISEVCQHLDIKARLMLSSQIEKNNSLRGQEKIIEICKLLNTTVYINPHGGAHLYSGEYFASNGIQIKFLRPKALKYRQFKDEFIPNLSIIDVMMFNSKKEIIKALNEFELF